MQESPVQFLGLEDPLEKGQSTHSSILGLGSAGKESARNAGDLGLIPGLGRSPREGKGYPLQYSGLQNSMDSVVSEVTKSQIGLSDFHFSGIVRTESWAEDLGQKSQLTQEKQKPSI